MYVRIVVSSPGMRKKGLAVIKIPSGLFSIQRCLPGLYYDSQAA